MTSDHKLSAIKLLACNVDGVLTDGTVIYSSGNVEIKAFHIRDGLALKMAGCVGFPVVWLTGRKCDAVARRAAELNVQVYQGMSDKEMALEMVTREHHLLPEEIAYIGDDLNDLPAMQMVGLPIAVASAVPEVLERAQFVTKTPGGHGAVREVIEFIFRGQGRWEQAVDAYLTQLQAPVIVPRMPRSFE